MIREPDIPPDHELVARIKHGDEQALRDLYSRYVPRVYSFIARLCPPDIDPQDIVQEAFVRAWQKLKGFDPNKSFRTWIFSIAKYYLIDTLRRKRPLQFSEINTGDEMPIEERIEDTRELPHLDLDRQYDAAILEEVLSQLTPPQREAIILHVTEDFTFQEIADLQKEPMDTVKTRYRRAITKLRNLLISRKKDIT